jgi:hypothetical protein
MCPASSGLLTSVSHDPSCCPQVNAVRNLAKGCSTCVTASSLGSSYIAFQSCMPSGVLPTTCHHLTAPYMCLLGHGNMLLVVNRWSPTLCMPMLPQGDERSSRAPVSCQHAEEAQPRRYQVCHVLQILVLVTSCSPHPACSSDS